MADETERGQWSFTDADRWGGNGELTVSVTDKGVLFEIEQEHAVDSYNSNFTSQCLVPFHKLGELVATLSRAALSGEAS